MVYTFFAVEKKREEKTVFFAWGAYSLTLGIVMIIETQLPQILTGRPEIFSALKYVMVLILAYPQAVQIDAITKVPHKRFSCIVGVTVVTLLVIETAGNLFLHTSLYRLNHLSLIILSSNAVMNFIMLVKEINYWRAKHLFSISIPLLAANLILFVLGTIDIALYMRSNNHMTDWGRIIRSSYIVFILAILVLLLKLAEKKNHDAMRAEKYKAEARIDVMTGLMNKAAYLKKEASMTARLMKEREKGNIEYSFVIMSIDLNNLKKVNDTKGHEAGDRFIKNAADILRSSVGTEGEAYRVGGDEFLALIFGKEPEKTYFEVIEKLNRKVSDFNRDNPGAIPLSFAYGHAICKADQNYSIHDSERIADQEMYRCKKEMKAFRS